MSGYPVIVLCNGMVRSGSTLQYNLAQSIVESLGVGCGQAGIDARVVQGLISKPDVSDLPSTDLATDPWVYVLHSHQLERRFRDPNNAADMGREGRLRLLYIHRDLRDVAVSMKRTWAISFAECVEILDRSRENYEFIRAHADANWLLVQRYKDVMDDLPAAVAEIGALFGISIPNEACAEVASACSIENSQEITRELRRQMVTNRDALFGENTLMRERMAGTATVFLDRQTLMHHNHVSPNRGMSGVWRTQLPAPEAHEVVQRYGEWMGELGYECQPSSQSPRTD
jgi:hypothetical protein